MCPILDGYDIFLFPYTPSCEPRRRNQLAGDVLNLVAYRLRCKLYLYHPPYPATDSPVSLSRLLGGI